MSEVYIFMKVYFRKTAEVTSVVIVVSFLVNFLLFSLALAQFFAFFIYSAFFFITKFVILALYARFNLLTSFLPWQAKSLLFCYIS